MPEVYQQFITYAGGSVSTAGAKVAGGAKVTAGRTGAGVYTLTTADPIVVASGIIMLVALNTAAGQINAVITSSTVITVSTFAADGTTATDKAFSYLLLIPEPS